MKRKLWITALILLLVVAMCPLGVVLARYYDQRAHEGGSATSKPFYFTVDKLSGEENERIWSLYGGDEKVVTFKVQNYMDALRPNFAATTYNVSMTVQNNEGGPVPTLSESGNATLAAGADKSYTLTVPEGYKDGAQVVITVTSSAPYEKTMRLIFSLHVFDHPVSYSIVDTGIALKLYVTANESAVAAGKLCIDWSDVNATENRLQLDPTAAHLMNDGELVTMTSENSLTDAGGNRYLVRVFTTKELKVGQTFTFEFIKWDREVNLNNLLQQMSGSATYADGTFTVTLLQNPAFAPTP